MATLYVVTNTTNNTVVVDNLKIAPFAQANVSVLTQALTKAVTAGKITIASSSGPAITDFSLSDLNYTANLSYTLTNNTLLTFGGGASVNGVNLATNLVILATKLAQVENALKSYFQKPANKHFPQ